MSVDSVNGQTGTVNLIAGEIPDAASRADLAAPAGAALVGFLQAGLGATPRTSLDKAREATSVFDFGAIGDSASHPLSERFATLAAAQAQYPHAQSLTDEIDWAATQAAINAMGTNGGGVWVPNDTRLRINRPLSLKQGVILRGESRYCSVIDGGGAAIHGIDFEGQSAGLENLGITSFDIGIYNGQGNAYYGHITDCRIIDNRIGIVFADAYINTVSRNLIVFNDCGMVTTGQGYAVHIHNNQFDNNTGGCGLIVLGSSGAVVEKNTIEGNRNIAVTVNGGNPGVGMILAGLNQRLSCCANWFESNGSSDSATDVMIGGTVTSTVADVAAIIANCVPAEYQAAVAGGHVGQADFSNNFHFATKHGYLVTLLSNPGMLSIESDVFAGTLDKFNKFVRLIGAAASGTPVRLKNLLPFGASTAIQAQLNMGIRNTCVFQEGVIPAKDVIQLDGQDLFTVTMSVAGFLALPGATINPVGRLPTSGTASLRSDTKLERSTTGLTTRTGTGRIRLGASGVLTVGEAGTLIMLGSVGSSFAYAYSAGTTSRQVTDGDGNTFSAIPLVAPTTAEATLFSGDYWGYVYMTPAQYTSTFRGARRLEITDLRVVSSRTYGPKPTSSLQLSAVGDEIYNPTPAAGGYEKFICVTAGTPGLYKGAGLIES